MLTVQQVYDLTIKLMNEQDDSTGTTTSSELDTYKNRAIALINILASDLYDLSDNTTLTAGSRPVPALLTDFTDCIDLDDRLTVDVLPYGLAGLLLKGENEESASYFNTIYYSNQKKYSTNRPTKKEPITNVYGRFSSKVRGEI